MSKNGSEKEFILTLFLLKYPQYLEELIGQRLEQAETEVPIGRRKVDLFAVNLNRRLPIFIETQVKQSDKRHLEKVLEIMDVTSEGTIIWIASGFNESHLERVRTYMRCKKHKYIDFHALYISQEAIEVAGGLNELYKLDIWGELDRLADLECPPLEQYCTYSQVPPSHTGRATGQTEYDFDRDEDVKQYMLEKLREYVPYLTNVWRAKKHNQNDCQLTLGGGRNGINYKVSARNRNGLASIYLHFDRFQQEQYLSYEKRITELQTSIHPMLQAKDRRIGVSFEPSDELDDTIRRLANILEGMLKEIGPELFLGKLVRKQPV